MRRLRPLAIGALTLLALLAGAEGLARLLHAAPTPSWLPHPLLGRVRPASWSTERVSIEDGSTFAFTTNSLGFRGRSIEGPVKPKGTYRIFFVGASTTENPNLPEEKTYAAIVERLLNERLKGAPRVETGNAGISGNQSDGTLAQVAHRLLALEPDLILALEGNDFLDSLRDDWDPTTYNLAKPRPPRFSEWLIATSRCAALLDDRFASSMERDPRPQYRRRAKKRHDKACVDPPEDFLLRGRERFRQNLRRMSLLCEDAGVRFGLITVAWLYKKDQPADEDAVIWQIDPAGSSKLNLTTAAARRGVDAYNEDVRSVARERGALLVDLDTAVPHDLAHLVDDVHLTPKGNDVAAHAIVDVLLREGTLPSARH